MTVERIKGLKSQSNNIMRSIFSDPILKLIYFANIDPRLESGAFEAHLEVKFKVLFYFNMESFIVMLR